MADTLSCRPRPCSSNMPSDLGLEMACVKDIQTKPTQKSIKVFVRTRPLLQKEIDSGEQNILSILTPEKQILIEGGDKGTFTYDGVFDEDASQQDVFQQVVNPLLPLLKNGNNVTIIAYGQTGSGKTYSMGTGPSLCQEVEGILQKSIKALLKETKLPKKSSTPTTDTSSIPKCLKITFLEIYNATIYDLFSSREVVNTKHDGAGGLIPVGCHEEVACSVDEALSLLEKGNSLRQMTHTVMNPHSSRSHALISIVVSQKNGGCLRLVDLAGAEGVGRNHMEGKGFSEGVSINKGLLAIGKVLSSICNKDSYIPYRDSMLTRLLRDALGGNSYTSVVACVNPTSSNVSVTTNTLHFAEQARNVKTKPFGMSTIKRKGIKRPSEDVSATPSAYKKYINGNEKLAHNSTISTPGHKPPLSKVPKLNNTFTPLNNVSLVGKPWNFSVQSEFPPVPPFPHLDQPIFEEDSPTHSIIEPLPLNNVTIQMSPFAEKVQAKFEESMRQYDEKMTRRMKEMGIQIAQTMMEGLMNGRRRSTRLSKKKDQADENSNTPTIRVKNENTDTFPSLPEVIEQVVTKIMSNRENSIFGNAYANETKIEQSSTSRVPFLEISNLPEFQDVGQIKASNNVSISKDVNKPRQLLNQHLITSTAVCGNKLVRKSTRLSSRFNYNKTLAPSSTIVNLSPMPNNTISDIDFSSTMDTTIIFNGASPVFTNRHARTFHADLTANLVPGKSIHDETTLLYSPDQETTIVASDIFSNDVLGQPLFMDKTVCSSTQPVLPRRTSRKSALIAIQKNHALLSIARPVASKAKQQSSSKTLTLSRSMANQTTHESPTQTGICKWELVISPTLILNQEKEILSILNSGNLRELQKLPTVGPKTAMVIHKFRSAYGKFKKVENLKVVPGLPKSYYSRFMKANLVSQIEFK